MIPKKSSLASNIVWLYGLQGLNYLIPAALLPYLVRVLGVEQYGLIAFAQSVTQYFNVATDYGFNFSATRAIAQNREDDAEVSRIFWTVTTTKILFLLLGLLFLGGVVFAVPRFHANGRIYLAAYVSVIGNAIFPQWLFQGLERMSSISVITGIAKLASAVLVICFVHSPQDTLLATLLLSAGFFLAGVAGLATALRDHVIGFKPPSWKQIITVLRDGRHLFLTSAAISLYSNTNTFMVGLLAGNEQAAYFSLADKVIRAITGLVAPVAQAAYPHLIRLIPNSRPKALAFIRRMLGWSLGATFLIGVCILTLAAWVARLTFSHNAAAAIPLLQWLSIFPMLATVNYILGALVLIPFGFDRPQSRLLFALGLVNVVADILFIPFLGALGGVLAMTLVEGLQILGSAMILRRGSVKIFHATRD